MSNHNRNSNQYDRSGGGGNRASEPTVYQYEVVEQLHNLAKTPPPTANPSLILDKFVGYAEKTDKRGVVTKEIGKQWLKDRFVPLYQQAGLRNSLPRKGLENYNKRWEEMLRQEGAVFKPLQTAWRLAIHLGRASVVENGSVLLHRTLGVPYLPGQSLKGLARAYAKTQISQPRLDELFGCQDKDKGCEGGLVFFDAIPTRWPELKIDILNPHFGDWYSGRKPLPTDDQKPVPIYFLTVAGGSSFLFGVGTAGRLRHDPQAKGWAQEGLELLAAALQDLGAGAKTAAGYGQFVEDTNGAYP